MVQEPTKTIDEAVPALPEWQFCADSPPPYKPNENLRCHFGSTSLTIYSLHSFYTGAIGLNIHIKGTFSDEPVLVVRRDIALLLLAEETAKALDVIRKMIKET